MVFRFRKWFKVEAWSGFCLAVPNNQDIQGGLYSQEAAPEGPSAATKSSPVTMFETHCNSGSLVIPT